jgi:hypothetical protein
MNKLHKIILFAYLAFLSTSDISALSTNKQQEPMGVNPYTYSPIMFNAENGITGRYWAGNKKYPGKAFIEEEEYINIVAIKKTQLKQKSKKKLRKYKDYLGSYINGATNIEYYLYGNKKNPDKIDDGPDGDVITMLAIKNDYGIDE